jgi:bis(5'-nucleosyl)-tetraphosphatase (symmetrical)
MPTYAIGDIQGCDAQLELLLNKIDAERGLAKFIFVGDLVNRGPSSLKTIRRIRSLGNKATVLLGNHDLHLLSVAAGVRNGGNSDTVLDVLEAPDRDALLDWLRHQSMAHFENGNLCVHAGVAPNWTAMQTLSYASELQDALRRPDWASTLGDLFGNQPARWEDSLTGADRLRCIVNALTRIRYCTPDGVMDFMSKESMAELAPGSPLLPWFDVPTRKTRDVTVVFGHWSTLGLVMRENLIGLDTGCVWGGKLTAVRLEDRQVIQVDCPQHLKPG